MRRLILATAMLILPISIARADQAVSVGGGLALFNTPAKPVGSLVLIPGGDGQLGIRRDGSFDKLANNQLVRTRKAFVGRGLATLTIDRGVDVAAAVRYMQGVAKPVAVVATSRGSLRVAGALNAKPDALVLTSAMLDQVRSSVGQPSALPRTLVVHHRQDGCRVTLPGLVEPFSAWAKAKATVVWKTGGLDVGNPCRAKSYHGFNGLDGDIVGTVSSFVLSGR